MVWKTGIGDSRKGITVVRGHRLTDLIDKCTYAQAAFLVIRGTMPTAGEERMLNALLVSSIEHGLGAPSTTVARTVASTGNAMNAALAAGLLAQGKHHGGAVEDCMRILRQDRRGEDVVQDALAQGKVLAGFGHKIYTTDPRTERLFAIAREGGIAGEHITRALEIEAALEKAKGKRLCVNVDGAIAAVLCDMGFPPEVGNGIFAIARMPGLVAHITEEREERPYRRLSEEEYEYTGPMPSRRDGE